MKMAILLDVRFNNFKTPITVDYDNDYYIELENCLNRYKRHIEMIENLPKDCVLKTTDNINSILNSLQDYKRAQIGSAKENIKGLIERYCEDPFIISEIKDSYAFRGVAPISIRSKKFGYDKRYKDDYEQMCSHELSFFKARVSLCKLDIKDMLHIPFNRRGLISTQRFSIPGVPCIYASTTTLGCWIEMDMPDPNKFQVSSYKIPESLKVLNLCINEMILNGSTGGGWVEEHELDQICSKIEIFPIVLATSFRVLEENRHFKSEYIISQLIMQSLLELKIDAVAYESKRMSSYYAYPQAVNLAVPVYSNESSENTSELNLYWEKAKDVKITEPEFYGDFLSKTKQYKNDDNNEYKSYVNCFYGSHSFHNKVIVSGDIREYTETNFSKFDEYILRKEFLQLK